MAVSVDPSKKNTKVTLSGRLANVTPADDTELTIDGRYPRGIFVGTGGDVVIYDGKGDPFTFKNVSNGQEIKGITITGISASTTASNIIAYS